MTTTGTSAHALTADASAPSGRAAIHWDHAALIDNVPPFHANGPSPQLPDIDPGVFGSQYGRMLQLADGTWLEANQASLTNSYAHDQNGGLRLRVHRSHDHGHNWTHITTIAEPGRDLDNPQLIQRRDGTILMACRSVIWEKSYRLPVYASSDGGQSWQYLSMIDSTLGPRHHGLYEPHMNVLPDGQLAVMYANETHPGYSQVISQRISDNGGRTWSPETWPVHQQDGGAARPGMPVWTRMRNGRYILAYEVCDVDAKCYIHYKTSPDGATWPSGYEGKRIPNDHQQYGGPYILSLSDGLLVLTSNSHRISLSDDYGATWYENGAMPWSTGLWASIYQTTPHEIAVVNSVERTDIVEHTGKRSYNVQARFGHILPQGA